MARIAIPIQTIPGFDAGAGAELDWHQADPAEGNWYVATGREMILAMNTSETDSCAVSILADNSSSYREFEQTLPAGWFGVLPFPTLRKFGQGGHIVWLDTESDDVSFVVLRLPTSGG